MTVHEPDKRLPLNAYTRATRQGNLHADASGGTGVELNGGRTTANNASKGVLPHIRDLQGRSQAKLQGCNTFVPIRSLLGAAQASVTRVNTDVTYKRPEFAYIEYLVSSEILLNVIPRHKDFASMKSDRNQWGQLYNNLRKQNGAQQSMIEEIKRIIEDDNIQNNTLPDARLAPTNTAGPPSQPGSTSTVPRPLSMPGSPKTEHVPNDELFIDLKPVPRSPRLDHNIQREGRPAHFEEPSQRSRPTVQPKPLALHSQALSHSDQSQRGSNDALSERFSQIRVQQKTHMDPPEQPRESSESTPATQPFSSPSKPGSPKTSFVPLPATQSSTIEIMPQGRPSGPRDMPARTSLPPPPPKIPIDLTNQTPFPRAPSPAYNPSRTIAPSLNTQLVPPKTSNRLEPEVEILPPRPPLSGQHGHLNGNGPSSRSGTSTPRPQSGQTAVTAAQLYENMRTMKTLVIDVRDRAEYDEGHIHTRSTMCIEPLSLRSGISAEDVEDRLVLSPETELEMFEHRNEFDLVVYYDQKTPNDRFLVGPPTRTEANALRALYDSLYEFNDYKPLRRPPVVLIGGLDAWVDLVGAQALATSSTSAHAGSKVARRAGRKIGRPLGRVPKASANSSLEVRKRRLREQNALNPDEERKWIEKAQTEEVNIADFEQAQSDGERASIDEEPPSPFIHSYEDFLRKFPDVSTQQSMTAPSMPIRSLPPPPPPPPPPSRRPPSQLPPPPPLPTIPSRPAPALPRPSYGGVSDRESLQGSPITRQSSSAQYPLFTPRSTSRFLKLPRTGLVNFGVTCYMNATIQCLLATIPLSQFFLDNRWRNMVQKNWKGSNGVMPGIFANLIRSLWCDDCTAIRPTSLRGFCARLNQEWGEDRQQDAKEYFDFIVDCLHEDLNMNFNRHPLQPLTTKQEMVRERLPIRQVSKTEWDRYSHREQSPISDFFAGQHASRLRCTTCHNTSTTYEAFYSISVEIPRNSNKQGWDIHDCLRSYTQEERLDQEEMWKCPFCKCEREATKQITITRAPNFLVVHFKRFEMRKGESAKKIHTPINFPLFGLDMGPYMIPPPSEKEEKELQGTTHGPDTAMNPPYLYDAYAVMRHLGQTGNGGHYISLVRDASRACWRKFDDDRATDFDPAKMKPDQKLQNEQAYILFYCRVPAR